MATKPGPVNLSVVTQNELSWSVQKLAVAAPFHRLKCGFVERFLSRRERHFDHFQINVIDPDTIFQARLYNEKPRVTFEQVEIAEVQEYISQGFWAWSGDPVVSPSGVMPRNFLLHLFNRFRQRKRCRRRQLGWLLLL